MGNIIQSTVEQCTQASTIEKPKKKIFQDQENIAPIQGFSSAKKQDDDTQSEIVPIIINPDLIKNSQQQIMVPRPRSDLGSEIENLWSRAVQEQSRNLQKQNVKQYLEDGSFYEGEWFKGTMHGNGKITAGNMTIYEGEFKLGVKEGQGIQYFTNRTYNKIIPPSQVSDRQYWSQYNGSFENDKMNGEGILELINGSCIYGSFKNNQLHGQLTYEWSLDKWIIQMRQLYKFTVAKQCYYKLLNLSTDCTQEEVKKAFFDLAKKYHPDVNPNTSVDPEQFRLIQEAYQNLSNEQKRKIYDDANGIIGKQYMGSPDFGENEDIYQKYMSQKERHIRNNEDEYTEYFNRQYFKNPEYFKRKLDEDNKWNMSEQLFMKHNENIGQKKEDWILHQPNPHNHYYVHKDEFKMTKQQQIMGFLKETKGIFLLIFLFSGIYIGTDIYSNQNKGKQKIEEKGLVKNATGYRIKMMPINIA